MLATYEAFLRAYRILSAIGASESGATVQVNGLRISAAVSDALIANKLRLKEVPADGHCQYNAVIRQVKLIGGLQEFHGLTVDQLRGLAADWLQRHPELYPFLSEHDGQDWDTYVSYVRTGVCDGHSVAWGDNLTLLAVANIFGAEIHVWSPFHYTGPNQPEQSWAVISPEQKSEAAGQQELRLMHQAEHHYWSIEPSEDHPGD
jgi:hypothetical protein